MTPAPRIPADEKRSALDEALDRLKTCQDLIISQITDPMRLAAGMERTEQKWPTDDDLFVEQARAELAALHAERKLLDDILAQIVHEDKGCTIKAGFWLAVDTAIRHRAGSGG